MNRREAIKHTSLLMGYAVSASAIGGLMGGCKSEPKAPDWAPSFFTKTQMPTIESIAETLLPKTQTYGANDVGVPQFIDAMLHEGYTVEEQQYFREDMSRFETAVQTVYNTGFTELEAAQQIEALKNAEIAAKDIMLMPDRKDEDPKPFFSTMIELTILGYLSSEQVGKELLTYDPIPGSYLGCIPYSEVGKKWAPI